MCPRVACGGGPGKAARRTGEGSGDMSSVAAELTIGPGRAWPALGRRLVQLYLGLVLYGLGMALQIRATLGLDPWDVLHQGIARRLGLGFGTVVIAVGAVVLLLWIPLRQRPSIGTV